MEDIINYEGSYDIFVSAFFMMLMQVYAKLWSGQPQMIVCKSSRSSNIVSVALDTKIPGLHLEFCAPRQMHFIC